MSLTSGNNQAGLPGATLALPLTVTVTGAASAPFPGARVVWSVSSGSAALGSPIDTSDANGVSTTTVTVGVVPGNIVVTATVTGVTPVSFQLTALDPCVARQDVAADTTITNGVLTNFDCAVFIGSAGPFFTDFYRFTLPAQAGLQVTMTASYDTYVEQFHNNGAFISFNDDTDSANTNSRIRIIAGAGTYVLAASTFAGSVTGAYTLDIAPGAEALTGCRNENFLPWLTRGVTLADSVATTDCTTIRGGGGRGYGDRALIVLTPTRTLNALLSSAAFSPRLELYELPQTGGVVFRAAADGVAGTATLNYTPTAGGIFRLEMTSVDTVQTGTYTLEVGGTVPNVADVITLPLPPSPTLRHGREAKRR